MPRAVIDLDQSATILEVAERIAAVEPEQDVVLVAAAGAPWLRNRVFVEVARTLAEPRRFALVTSDQRARSLAASVHVPAYSSVTALDRHELDATERLVRRRAAAASGRASRLRPPAITRRGIAIAASLLAAVLLVLAVVMPEAVVTVAPTTQALGPLEFQLRAGPGGEIERATLSDTVTAKIRGTASGSREEPVKAKGAVQLGNKQTRSMRILAGTVFRTSDNIQFVSTEEKTLPSSLIFPPITLTVGMVEVPVEAVTAGKGGNLSAGRITVSPAPNDYTVTNAQPTAGGDLRKIPIVEQRDYADAQARAATELHAAANARLARWRTEARAGTTVIARVYSAVSSLTPASEVLKKEVETFELTVTGTATAFSVASDEPRTSALERLRRATLPGYGLDAATARVDATLLDDPGGTGVVVWTVRASGSQLARIDTDRIRRALAGRGLEEVASILQASGVRLVELRREPPWWPRVPLLDARIRVSEVPATGQQ